jgi:hypothetical protein
MRLAAPLILGVGLWKGHRDISFLGALTTFFTFSEHYKELEEQAIAIKKATTFMEGMFEHHPLPIPYPLAASAIKAWSLYVKKTIRPKNLEICHTHLKHLPPAMIFSLIKHSHYSLKTSEEWSRIAAINRMHSAVMVIGMFYCFYHIKKHWPK